MAASKLVGRGDEKAADQAAVDGYARAHSGGGANGMDDKTFDELSAMVDAAGTRFNLPAERITYLAAKPEGAPGVSGESTKENVDAALKRIAESAGPNDRAGFMEAPLTGEPHSPARAM